MKKSTSERGNVRRHKNQKPVTKKLYTMISEKLQTKDLFAAFDKTKSEIIETILSEDQKTINTVPFKNSWTAAQTGEHIRKSVSSIAQAMEMQGKITERNPEEKVGELKKMFLNFTIKYKSPAFIVPGEGPYYKETLAAEISKTFEQLNCESNKVNLAEAITHEAFGEITKLELLYFVAFHSQRHLHQMKNILSKLHTITA